MTDQAALPYPEPGGDDYTGGWSGSDTSHERAVHEARTGKARARQDRALRELAAAGDRGLTWRELDEVTGWHHHGTTSGVLSVLHRANRIARLTLRRQRCRVYVDLQHVDGRETDEAGRTAANRDAYDQGHRDGLLPAADAYAEGYRDGAAHGRREATTHVLAVVQAMLAAMGSRTETHHAECWRKHPACALEAVRGAIRVSRTP